jgi:hypothetical protein
VDFGEFTASIAGQVMKLYMFCMRLSHSGNRSTSATPTKLKNPFLEGMCAPSRPSLGCRLR